MNNHRKLHQQLSDWLQLLLLVGGMLGLLAVLGLSLAGTTGLLWALGLGLVFLMFGQRVSPQLVFRMYGGRPLSVQEAPGLYRLAAELSRRAELPSVPRLYHLPGPFTNAVTVGERREAGIGVTAPLLRRLDRRELTAVLAHEISHIRQNDTRLMQVAGTINRLTGLISFFGKVLLFVNLPLLIMGQVTFSWLAILLLIFAPMLSGLLQLALSRRREFDADLGAVHLTGDPEGLAAALQKLEYYQTGWLRRFFFPTYRMQEPSLFQTHPRTEERVRRLRAQAMSGPARPLPPLEDLLVEPARYSPRPGWPRWHYI